MEYVIKLYMKNCLPDIPTPSTATLQPPTLSPGSIQAMLVAE